MKEVKNFAHLDKFNKFNAMQNPFIIMTVRVKVTNLVKYAKKYKHFYMMFGYLLAKTVNEVEAFRYRYIDNKFYICDRVGVSYTERIEDDIVFFDCYNESLEDFMKEYDEKKTRALNLKKSISEERYDVIWVSCLPWNNFSALVSPFDKSITMPQFIWDKYKEVDNDYYCNLMLMVHHGFADGYHVADFIQKLEKNIEECI